MNYTEITPVWALPRWYRKTLIVKDIEIVFHNGKKFQIATIYDEAENETYYIHAMGRTWKGIEEDDVIEVIKDPVGDVRTAKLIVTWVRNECFP